jgi:hypothetical protein
MKRTSSWNFVRGNVAPCSKLTWEKSTTFSNTVSRKRAVRTKVLPSRETVCEKVALEKLVGPLKWTVLKSARSRKFAF